MFEIGDVVHQPIIVVFDSGLGGITVYRQLKKMMPKARYIYVADNAAFPYGAWEEGALSARILEVMSQIIERYNPDLLVIACNTASTIALSALRQKFSMPVVGTVPAIKVAAENTKSKMFSVLATEGTVKRQYTHDLIAQFASDCHVSLVGSASLAQAAEQKMRGEVVDIAQIRAMISTCFVSHEGRKTDYIALACTHFPLLLEELEQAALWPVHFIDPAQAIARQVSCLLERSSGKQAMSAGFALGHQEENLMIFSAAQQIEPTLQSFLQQEQLGSVCFL